MGTAGLLRLFAKINSKLYDIHINLVNLLIDILYPIYSDPYNLSKAETMNQEIQARLSKIQKLGLSVPEYVTTGEKFIDYINNLTDAKVPYKEKQSLFRTAKI